MGVSTRSVPVRASHTLIGPDPQVDTSREPSGLIRISAEIGIPNCSHNPSLKRASFSVPIVNLLGVAPGVAVRSHTVSSVSGTTVSFGYRSLSALTWIGSLTWIGTVAGPVSNDAGGPSDHTEIAPFARPTSRALPASEKATWATPSGCNSGTPTASPPWPCHNETVPSSLPIATSLPSLETVKDVRPAAAI